MLLGREFRSANRLARILHPWTRATRGASFTPQISSGCTHTHIHTAHTQHTHMYMGQTWHSHAQHTYTWRTYMTHICGMLICGTCMHGPHTWNTCHAYTACTCMAHTCIPHAHTAHTLDSQATEGAGAALAILLNKPISKHTPSTANCQPQTWACAPGAWHSPICRA